MRRRTLVALAVVALVVAASGAGASAANGWPTRPVAATISSTGPPVFVVRANGAVTAVIAGGTYGDARRLPLAQPITGIAATVPGTGYWLAASDGGVFSYGDARFFGSMAGVHLNAPIVGIAATKDGRGYWLAAADGGIFTFGDARFFGSLAGHRLDQPIVGITTTRTGKGYRLLAKDGGVFTFGDATYQGSLGGTGLTDVIGFAPTPSGNGYWILRKNGGTYEPCGLIICSIDPRVAGPSVTNFGDAQPLSPYFLKPASNYFDFDVDFAHDPVVAIVAKPVPDRRGQGYVVIRADPTRFGFGGLPPGV